ncbi:MAG: serine hydrolase [Limnohabitans sp.]|jgi:serine-type D-Ala-D-Ala endopeptidase (penicillin-binding protein 7)|nr:serine hydrolase [Limnohabitans sp.]
MSLKTVSHYLSPKSWLRVAVLALTVGLITIVSSQLSLAYAQDVKQSPARVQKNKKNVEKSAAPRHVQKAKKKGSSKNKVAKSSARKQKVAKATRKTKNLKARDRARPIRASFGQMAGLHNTSDALGLRSSVALVVDQETQEVLYSKNNHAVLPIASLTKLMTGLVIAEANLPMDERIRITQADIDTEKGSTSRLAVGTELSRGELMHLSLMSSENRAAHALGRTFPGGMDAFVSRMNLRAQALGMKDTRYVEPTGLSSQNQSSASDLAVLAAKAYDEPMLRELSTSHGREVAVGRRTLQFNNTNGLVKSPQWDIGLQKTGYISEAGRCLVMQAQVAGRNLIMVFLDSTGKLSRIGDAERVRKWLEQKSSMDNRSLGAVAQMPG